MRSGAGHRHRVVAHRRDLRRARLHAGGQEQLQGVDVVGLDQEEDDVLGEGAVDPLTSTPSTEASWSEREPPRP
jgi:hypothetical protein